MKTTRLLLATVTLPLLAGVAQATTPAEPWLPTGPLAAQQAKRVGEEVALGTWSRGYGGHVGGDARLVWRDELHYPGAGYVAPHFSRFDLPPGASLIVKSPDGARSWTYRGTGKGALGTNGAGFWGIHVYGDTAVVELWSRGARVKQKAVVIDRIARGFHETELGVEPKAICGADDSGWAKCYQSSEATIYSESRAVARLMINGTGACTGWLVGSEGHVMTNEHCIGSASDAANTTFEFMAEGASCSTDCASWGACPGTTVATTSTLVKVNAALDYALVRLPTNPTATYGYMQLRSSGATLNERIYVPQHPAAWGKKIAVNSTAAADTGGVCRVSSLSEAPCSGSGYNDVGYYADTQGGSSGSPVLGYSDHLVVALHHCANCPNRAVPIQRVISDLGSSLPANALGGGGGGNNPPTANFTFSTSNLTASFTDTSSDSDGTIASRSWNFGDGGTSTATNPTRTYAAAGTYNVSLTVTDDDGATGSTTRAVAVSAGITALSKGVAVTGLSGSTGAQTMFSFAVPSGASNLTFNLSGGTGDADLYVRFGSQPTTSTYDCRSWASGNTESCSFASPSTGTYYALVHAYATYSGAQIVANYTTTTNTPPTANFTFTTSNLTATFTDTSTDAGGSVVGWSWNFGDGTTSTTRNPVKTYSSAGTRTVSLTVTDNGGLTGSTSKSVTVSSTPTCTAVAESESNNTTGTADALVAPCSTVAGTFTNDSSSQKNDYYRMTVPAGATITGLLNGLTVDYDLYLYRSGSSTAVASSTNGGTTADQASWTNTTGASTTVYVRVYRYSSTRTTYALRVSY